ncbi:MAG: nucleotide exchange factor GrpE [Chlamydiae bacterium]|nr:nucleotide exchange factor GrpE [Chlamydiota bacterium]
MDPEENQKEPTKEELLQKELKETQDKYLRTLAELENMRKRLQKEKQEMIGFAIENTICEFLPLLDNFENALKFAQIASNEVKGWASGFQMLLTQFRDVIHNHGIVAFHSEGNLFDPAFHEAMEVVESNDHPDCSIIEEFAKGYKSANRTIRPAKVKVCKKPEIKEEPIAAEEETAPSGEENNLN